MARRGITGERADTLVGVLARRDAERDERHMCLECARLLPNSGRCTAAADGLLPWASRRAEPLPALLQRCSHFIWSLP